jgi:hypothetical protein
VGKTVDDAGKTVDDAGKKVGDTLGKAGIGGVIRGLAGL